MADHNYLSTGCYHGDHAYCKNMVGINGLKRGAIRGAAMSKAINPHGYKTDPRWIDAARRWTADYPHWPEMSADEVATARTKAIYDMWEVEKEYEECVSCMKGRGDCGHQ